MYDKLYKLQEEVLEGLANHKRLEILQLLVHGELNVNQMVKMLAIPQANLSQHLSILRNLQLVITRRRGQSIFYSLSDKRIAELLAQLREFLRHQYSSEPEIAKVTKLAEKSSYPITTDLVCGMRISAKEAAAEQNYRGRDYHFCGEGCWRIFRRQPAKYIKVVKAGVK